MNFIRKLSIELIRCETIIHGKKINKKKSFNVNDSYGTRAAPTNALVSHFFFLRQAVERNNSLNDTNYHKRLFQISHRLQSEEVRLKEKGNFSLS